MLLSSLQAGSRLVAKPADRLTQKISRYVHAWPARRRSQPANRAGVGFTPDQAIVTHLVQDGICVTSLADLGLPQTAEFWQAATQLMQRMPDRPAAPADDNPWDVAHHAINFHTIDLVEQAPELYQFGLQQRLLRIIESYLAAPIYYLSADLRRDLANDREVGSRTWHRDREDRRMVKIIIYLNDVSDDGGAFEYIPERQSLSWWRLGRQAILSSEALAQQIPRDRWQRCPGAAGTVILVDVARLLHHGTVPLRDRFALFYNYTSRRPRDVTPYTWLTAEPYASQLRAPLAQWQKPYLLPPATARSAKGLIFGVHK
jgi:hypothetical protein